MTDAILVTGGAGFIGSHVVDALLADERFAGMRIVVVDDLSGGSLDNVPETWRVTFYRGDIGRHEFIDTLFASFRFRYVFHFAAYAAEGLSPFVRRFNYQNNLIGSVNLINAAIRHGVERFVFTSSAAVYGHDAHQADECDVAIPIDPYGVAKLAVEMDLRCAAESHGLDFTILRPHNVYGERQNLDDPYRNVLGIFMRQCLDGVPMTIFGDGQQTRQFSHIGDVAPLIAESAIRDDCKNEVINIGSDDATSVNTIAMMVGDAMGGSGSIERLPPRHEARAVTLCHGRAKAIFGEYAKTPLERGIERMAAWAKTAKRKTPVLPGVEVERGLPPSWQRVGGLISCRFRPR
jgi:UDP-glucose 4-epimerase